MRTDGYKNYVVIISECTQISHNYVVTETSIILYTYCIQYNKKATNFPFNSNLDESLQLWYVFL